MLRKTTVFLSLLSTFLLGNEVSWGTISPGKERDLAEKQKLSTQASGDWGGLAAFGEVGPKNLRGSATYGVYFNPLTALQNFRRIFNSRIRFSFKFSP